jgi:hypothetical protein
VPPSSWQSSKLSGLDAGINGPKKERAQSEEAVGGYLELVQLDFTPQEIDTNQDRYKDQGVGDKVPKITHNASQAGDKFCKHGITSLFVFTDQRCPKTNLWII